LNGLDIVEVAGAGAVGAVARYYADWAVRLRWPSPFPMATVAINVLGSLVLGVLTGLVLYHGAPARLTLVAGTGFCGGFTTFSTYSYETVRLVGAGRTGLAAANVAVTLVGALGAAAAGLGLASL
jgi:CrcB protein